MFITVPSLKLLCSLLQLRYQRVVAGAVGKVMRETSYCPNAVVGTPESHLGSVGVHVPPGHMKCFRARAFLSEDSLSKGGALRNCRTG